MAKSESKGMTTAQDIPRWAKELDKGKWQSLNELLYEGWRPSDVMRKLKIPASKRRSLELYAKKYRHRRILAPLSKMRELIVRGATEAGPKAMTALRVMVAEAVNDEIEPTRRQRAISVLLQVFELAERIGQGAEKAEAERKREEQPAAVGGDPVAAFKAVCAEYGIAIDGDK